MAKSKEAKRQQRAEEAAARTEQNAAAGITPKPRGRVPEGKLWDETKGMWVDVPATTTASCTSVAHGGVRQDAAQAMPDQQLTSTGDSSTLRVSDGRQMAHDATRTLLAVPPSRSSIQLSRSQRRVLQRGASSSQSERHLRKHALYDSGGRLWLRRHPEVVRRREVEDEEKQERLNAWQKRYESDLPTCSFAEHAWRIYNCSSSSNRRESMNTGMSMCPAREESTLFLRNEAAAEGAREDYDDCLEAEQFASRHARRLLSGPPVAD